MHPHQATLCTHFPNLPDPFSKIHSTFTAIILVPTPTNPWHPLSQS